VTFERAKGEIGSGRSSEEQKMEGVISNSAMKRIVGCGMKKQE